MSVAEGDKPANDSMQRKENGRVCETGGTYWSGKKERQTRTCTDEHRLALEGKADLAKRLTLQSGQ